MKKLKLLAVLLAAVAGTQCLTGCSKKKSSSVPLYAETAVQTPTNAPIGGEELSGDNYNAEQYEEKLVEYIEAMEIDDDALVLGSVGDELIYPEEGAVDYELGPYRLSSSGIKLYYNEEDIPQDLILTFEKYFAAFASADYNTYHKCLFPGYSEEMDAVAENTEGAYDIRSTFIKRCSELAGNMNGDFKITRIKLERNYPSDENTDIFEQYFQVYNNYFGKDYYSEIKEQSDEFIATTFYIMSENAYGQENMLLQEKKLAFAVKDGKYYTFG